MDISEEYGAIKVKYDAAVVINGLKFSIGNTIRADESIRSHLVLLTYKLQTAQKRCRNDVRISMNKTRSQVHIMRSRDTH